MECNCTTCPHEAEIAELKRDAERNSSQHREFYNKFAENDKHLALVDERYNTIQSTLGKIESKVDELCDKPGKKWDQVSMYAITAFVGAILGYIINTVL